MRSFSIVYCSAVELRCKLTIAPKGPRSALSVAPFHPDVCKRRSDHPAPYLLSAAEYAAHGHVSISRRGHLHDVIDDAEMGDFVPAGFRVPGDGPIGGLDVNACGHRWQPAA